MLDSLDARSAELCLDSGREIGINLTIYRMDDLASGWTRGRDLSGHVDPHLVAARADSGPDTSPYVAGEAPKALHHRTDRRFHHTDHDATPSSVRQSYHLSRRIEQQDWRTVSKAHHQRHARCAGYQSIRLRTDSPTLPGTNHVHRCPVHLPGADNLLWIQPKRIERSPVVLLNRRQVIANCVTQIKRGIRTATDAADARQNGVNQAIGAVQTFKAI